LRNKKLIVLLAILGSVTLLAVLSSVIFSVQQIHANCINDYDAALDALLEDPAHNGIKKGRSIFLLDEKELIGEIEAKPEFSAVSVVNIERGFPNRVYIHYVKILPYLAFDHGEDALYLSNELKVLDKAEGQAAYPDHIRLLAGGAPSGTEQGAYFYQTDGAAYGALRIFMEAFERLGSQKEVTGLFEFIDVKKTAEYGITYLKTRTGVYIKVFGCYANTLTELRYALKLYAENDAYRSRGMIVVGRSGENIFYKPADDYS
jgi:hypothetical protein